MSRSAPAPAPRGHEDGLASRRPEPLDGMERAALAYREACRHGDEVDPTVLLESWGQSFVGSIDQTRVFRDAHHSDPRAADRLAIGLTSLPEVGDEFLGFRLIGELGRGAFGRVFLARQGELADRPVALKVTPQLSGEPRMLAQLQHTSIVPVYSIHRAGPLQAVCMPYFGSTTLRDVYENLEDQEVFPVSGRGLLSTLYDRKGSTRPGEVAGGPGCPTEGDQVSAPGPGPMADAAGMSPPTPFVDTLRYLERLTYVQAVLWVGSRLASGLAHAHERGILHRDLKPANVLLTDEGQPMLLDFNLAEDLKTCSGAAASVGGTLHYMAPEHLDAFQGGSRPADARSDLYSIGVILYELLTGTRPFPIPDGPADEVIDRMIGDRLGPSPHVRCWNQGVTPAAEAIVRHCLDPDPDRRYQTALELQEDLERQLSDRPLRHTPEPSLRERAAKWARRHPTWCSSTTITTLALALVGLLSGLGWCLVQELRTNVARVHRAAFSDAFEECQLLLNTEVASSHHLADGIQLARQALGRYNIGGTGDWTASPLISYLPEAEQEAQREELSELVQLEARACVASAGRGGSDAELDRALRRGVARLDVAERLDPRPTAALFEDRARYHRALGQHDLANRDLALATRVPPRTARDYTLLGVAQLARGDIDAAELALGRAIALGPDRFWAWFALGICHADQGRHADAAHDFSVCTTLARGLAWPQLNRGLALARSGRLPEARLAYDRALEIEPDFVEALVDRALTVLELDDPTTALRDLDRAIALGRREPDILVARGEILARLGRRPEAEREFAEAIRSRPLAATALVARGFARLEADPPGAEADLTRALELNPDDARVHLGLAYLLRPKDPRAALGEVERALAINPDLGDALQLRALIRARLGDRPGTEADLGRLLLSPTPRRLYNAACCLALLMRSNADPRLPDRALTLLRRAIASGLPATPLADDPDLAVLHDRDDFRRLTPSPGTRQPSTSGP